MDELQNKLSKLMEDDPALYERIRQQETFDAAYAIAKSALPGLTAEEFRDWARTAFPDRQTLTDAQMEDVAGGQNWNYQQERKTQTPLA